ncbi:uncharacterized protein [Mobula birostris]|uniref:uncharacterized protein n=1 Tax=Mobula birostris TaxID=1983395 RepID=UPI003B281B1F
MVTLWLARRCYRLLSLEPGDQGEKLLRLLCVLAEAGTQEYCCVLYRFPVRRNSGPPGISDRPGGFHIGTVYRIVYWRAHPGTVLCPCGRHILRFPVRHNSGTPAICNGRSWSGFDHHHTRVFKPTYPEASTMDQPDGSSTGQPTPSPSSVSVGETSSDSQSDIARESQGSPTGKPGPVMSITPAGSSSSRTDPQSDITPKLQGTVTGSSTGKQTDGSVSGEHTQKSSSVPAGDTSPDPGTSTGKQSEGSSTGDFSQETTSVPAGDTASGERMWIKVQLTSSGNMSEDEVWEATRQKIWELFGDPNLQIKLVRFRAKPSEE